MLTVSERDAAAGEPILLLPRPTQVRAIIIAIMSLIIAITGCGHIGAAKSGQTSGIRGITRVDSGCPVVTSTPCPTVPLRARLLIRRLGAEGRTFRAESDSSGHFQIALDPGRYRIWPENISGAAVPTALPVNVTVRSGTWTIVHIQFDSGVR